MKGELKVAIKEEMPKELDEYATSGDIVCTELTYTVDVVVDKKKNNVKHVSTSYRSSMGKEIDPKSVLRRYMSWLY
jgi:hypothetical protein